MPIEPYRMAPRRAASRLWIAWVLLAAAVLACGCQHRKQAGNPKLEWIVVSADGKSFVGQTTGTRFTPWGFNYDHDEEGRLLEDYWESEWEKVAADVAEMKHLGANVVRVHLQLGKFMENPSTPRASALNRLRELVHLAERERLYLDITGLGCYHKADVPAWYDTLPEQERWEVQARFWEAVARVCRESPAIFCYDLMNEPVAPAGEHPDWLGPAFAGKHFVQFISRSRNGRESTHIARAWIQHLTAAIRKEDSRHLITVGLVDWSLDRPGLKSGFVPDQVAPDLDFLSVHLYPERSRVREALDTLNGFAVGKPVVIEETFPLKCSREEFAEFMRGSREVASGWIGFYWGATPEEYRASGTLQGVLMLAWLEYFQAAAREYSRN